MNKSKRVGWNISESIVEEIQLLCTNKKAISMKVEEILTIGLHYYKKGAAVGFGVIRANRN